MKLMSDNSRSKIILSICLITCMTAGIGVALLFLDSISSIILLMILGFIVGLLSNSVIKKMSDTIKDIISVLGLTFIFVILIIVVIFFK